MPVEQARKQHRHERILESALQVFSRKGYHDTAVDDIAAESRTSKGGVYFHFPNKQAIFLALLDRMASLLRSRVEAAIAAEADPIAKAEVALQVVLQTFASHRTLSRLFLVESLGAGREFHARMLRLRASFEALIAQHLDEAVGHGAIPPLDTAVASRVWFGALNEVLTCWVLSERPTPLEATYPTVRALLLRGIGAQLISEENGQARSEDGKPGGASRTAQRGRGEPAWSAAELVARFEPLLTQAQARAQQIGQAVLASLVSPGPDLDPLEFFERGAGLAAERVCWTRARTGFALAGVGTSWAVESHGAARVAETGAAWRALVRDACVEAPPDTSGVGPILLAGFAFDPRRAPSGRWVGFPDGRAVLPRFLLTLVDGTTWLTVNAIVEPAAEPAGLARQLEAEAAKLLAPASGERPPAGQVQRVDDVLPAATWQAIVRSATDELRRGAGLEKVVLAREVLVAGDRPFDSTTALRRLRADYPSCFVFAFVRGERCFLGATPERLVRLRDRLVSTMCLAGTIRRGESDEQDRQLGERLLNDPKERQEHDVVVRALRQGLAELCEEVAPIGTPVLLKVRNVQHLLTTVVGRVADGRDLLDLVERLHPTPAVGGAPRERALALIRAIESLDRGWYAGPIGWLDAHGEGEFSVAIRSALLDGARASLYAGCGIVAESDPAAEYEESRWKLRPILAALGGQL